MTGRTAPLALALTLILAPAAALAPACSPVGGGDRPEAVRGGGPAEDDGAAAVRDLAAAFGRAAAAGDGCGLDYRTGLGRMLAHLLAAHAAGPDEARAALAALDRERERARRPVCDRQGLADALVGAQDEYNRAAAALERTRGPPARPHGVRDGPS